MDSRQRRHLLKFVHDLEQHKGRHTELVSVYVPAGYDIVKIMQHLSQEQGTATNIKDSTTRKNVRTVENHEALLDRLVAQCLHQERLPHAGRSHPQHVPALPDEPAAGQIVNLLLLDGRVEAEIEILQGL